MPPTVRGDKRAFFDISINEQPAGRIVFALWNFTCPKTVENFRALCTGELGRLHGKYACYQGSIFHRVIKGFMIQGGDITHGNGQGGFSIYGRNFDDENLTLQHKKPYLLSMANKGPDTNGSQFFITTEEQRHLDGKHTVFGEVIKGFEIVQQIENMETGDDDKPLDKVEITQCGEMVRKGDAAAPEPEKEALPFEPPTRNWLMRSSKSPENKGRKHKRESSVSRRRGGSSRERMNRRRRSASRNGSRERNRKIRKTEATEGGVKVRGRGHHNFRRRSATPPHWRKEESKKLTLDEHAKRQEAEEEYKKRVAQREKEEAARMELAKKERKENEDRRELERLERKKKVEKRRNRRSAERKDSPPRRYKSPSEVKKSSRFDESEMEEPRIRMNASSSSSSSSSSSESSESEAD
ncbi:unnamed protein product [Caenorhabditis sp. 36 PRJEB53466]|nr:unnamed protein product [Caenorhabditis sp. 36 PRJEB53466]